MKHVLLAYLGATLLAGCAAMPKGSMSLFENPGHSSEVLSYAQQFSNLSAEAQKKEYAQTMLALNKNKSDTTSQIKAALIFGLPGSRYREPSKALPLLEDILQNKGLPADTKALASLLKDFINDDIKQAQKTRDEQKRAEILQQKLDELKNIEKTMTDRDQATHK